jgi:hypothetical protein
VNLARRVRLASGSLATPGAVVIGDIAAPADQPGQERVPGKVARFARRHAVFGGVLLVGAAVRVIAMLGFRGPLRTPDSTRYLRDAVHLAPGTVRPSGYSLLLWILEPLHSLMAVVGLQYAMGLGIGVMGYALLRRKGLPGWGAWLAMVPVLWSASAVQLEHFLLSDTLFAFLVMIAVTLMMWSPNPPLWVSAVAGLLLGAAALVRSEGTPVLIVFVIFVVARFAGWQVIARILVMCAAFAVPVTGYSAWFDQVYGKFELTSSTGAFLYGGVSTFADCAKIHPPAAERRLCLEVPVSQRKWGDYYIWRGPFPTIPGGPFGQRADSLGRSFALRAIEAQPLDYLRAAAGAFWEDFLPAPGLHSASAVQRNRALHQDQYLFPAVPPKLPSAQNARDFTAYDPAGAGLRIVQPYAGWLRAYQRYIFVPGPLLGVIVLAGLGGLIAAWRRFGGTALPWLVGLCLLLVPAAIVESYPRYLVGDIPPLCVAAALGIQQIAAAAKRPRTGRHAVG